VCDDVPDRMHDIILHCQAKVFWGDHRVVDEIMDDGPIQCMFM
jgi:hypothetical protein